MTHMSLLVIGVTPEQLDSVLDPFRKISKDRRYASFVIGGRNNGFFQLSKGGRGTLSARNGSFDPMPDPNTADSTLFKYWDRELQAKIQYDRAVTRHRYFYARLGNIELPVASADWKHFHKADSPLHGYSLESIYTNSEEAYATQAASRANLAFAIYKNGVIYERQFKGNAGSPQEEQEFEEWARTYAGLIADLQPDTPLVAVTAYEQPLVVLTYNKYKENKNHDYFHCLRQFCVISSAYARVLSMVYGEDGRYC